MLSDKLFPKEPGITNWRVVVITSSRQLNLGAADPGAEVLERRVSWVELQPECWPQGAAQSRATIPLFQRLLGLLQQPEEQIKASSSQVRQQTVGTAAESELDDVMAAIQVSRFPSRSIQEVCAMGGIAEGKARGKAEEAAAVTLRLLARRCGPLSPAITARIEALPLEQVEALAEALLDFQGPADLDAWLAEHD